MSEYYFNSKHKSNEKAIFLQKALQGPKKTQFGVDTLKKIEEEGWMEEGGISLIFKTMTVCLTFDLTLCSRLTSKFKLSLFTDLFTTLKLYSVQVNAGLHIGHGKTKKKKSRTWVLSGDSSNFQLFQIFIYFAY